MGRCAAGNGTGVFPWLDAGVIVKPLHSCLARHSPESVVDGLEGIHQDWPQGNGAGVKCQDGKATPPNVGFGKRANGGAGQAASPMIVSIGAQLVAGQPVDLVLLDPVVDLLALEGDAVSGAVDGAFATDLTEVFNAYVDGLVRYQGKVSHNGVRHMDAGAVFVVYEETVSTQLADSGGQP